MVVWPLLLAASPVPPPPLWPLTALPLSLAAAPLPAPPLWPLTARIGIAIARRRPRARAGVLAANGVGRRLHLAVVGWRGAGRRLGAVQGIAAAEGIRGRVAVAGLSGCQATAAERVAQEEGEPGAGESAVAILAAHGDRLVLGQVKGRRALAYRQIGALVLDQFDVGTLRLMDRRVRPDPGKAVVVSVEGDRVGLQRILACGAGEAVVGRTPTGRDE